MEIQPTVEEFEEEYVLSINGKSVGIQVLSNTETCIVVHRDQVTSLTRVLEIYPTGYEFFENKFTVQDLMEESYKNPIYPISERPTLEQLFERRNILLTREIVNEEFFKWKDEYRDDIEKLVLLKVLHIIYLDLVREEGKGLKMYSAYKNFRYGVIRNYPYVLDRYFKKNYAVKT